MKRKYYVWMGQLGVDGKTIVALHLEPADKEAIEKTGEWSIVVPMEIVESSIRGGDYVWVINDNSNEFGCRVEPEIPRRNRWEEQYEESRKTKTTHC